MSDHGHYSYEKAKTCVDQDVDMFACDKLFTPVDVPGHWFCIAVMVKDKRVVCYDSNCINPRNKKKRNREDELLLVHQFLVDEHFIQKGKPLLGQWKLEFTQLNSTPATR